MKIRHFETQMAANLINFYTNPNFVWYQVACLLYAHCWDILLFVGFYKQIIWAVILDLKGLKGNKNKVKSRV